MSRYARPRRPARRQNALARTVAKFGDKGTNTNKTLILLDAPLDCPRVGYCEQVRRENPVFVESWRLKCKPYSGISLVN